jgi:cytochrome b6
VVPVIGPFLLRFLRGGDEVTGATLTRFYGIHIAILPGLITLFLGIHLYLVQFHGMSVPPSVTAKKQSIRQMKFVPNFLLRDLLGWLLALGVLAALAALFPWELGEKADPFVPAPAGIRPEWYFAFMFQTLKYIPAKVLLFDGEVLGILAFGLGFLLWLLVPFFDKETAGRGRGRLFEIIGLVVIVYILILTALAYTSK